jgi:iron complex transport system ATP-binding protein
MLEATNLTVSYGRREAVKDVSLRIVEGTLTAVIGPNGAGKSTLLQTLNGGLKPSRGVVTLDGRSLESFSRRAIARHVAVVAQESEVRFPVTVLEFVLGGRYSLAGSSTWGWETDRDLDCVSRVLSETGLLALQARVLNELSGGERQRAVLARALATEAGHLLLDEPTANLDLAHQASILATVRRRCDSEGTAAVVVTHDVNLAAEFADHILLLQEGRFIAHGSPADVFTVELMEKAFAIQVLVDPHPISGAPRITPVHEKRSYEDSSA